MSEPLVIQPRNTRLIVIPTGPRGLPGEQGTAGDAAFTREKPTGVMDEVNLLFTTARAFLPNSTMLYWNGLAQTTPDDYAEISDTEIAMVEAPAADDHLIITYMEA